MKGKESIETIYLTGWGLHHMEIHGRQYGCRITKFKQKQTNSL